MREGDDAHHLIMKLFAAIKQRTNVHDYPNYNSGLCYLRMGQIDNETGQS